MSDHPEYLRLLQQAVANVGISQSDLAKKAGVTRATVRGIITGAVIGRRDNVEAVARVVANADVLETILETWEGARQAQMLDGMQGRRRSEGALIDAINNLADAIRESKRG